MSITYSDHIVEWNINELNSCIHHMYDLYHEWVSCVQYVPHSGAIGGKGQSSFQYNYIITEEKKSMVELVNKSNIAIPMLEMIIHLSTNVVGPD